MNREEMTREEAIRIAQGLTRDFKCESETMVEFCNVVIKALEQERILDKIRAEVPKLGLGIIGQNLVLELIDKYRKEN